MRVEIREVGRFIRNTLSIAVEIPCRSVSIIAGGGASATWVGTLLGEIKSEDRLVGTLTGLAGIALLTTTSYLTRKAGNALMESRRPSILRRHRY